MTPSHFPPVWTNKHSQTAKHVFLKRTRQSRECFLCARLQTGSKHGDHLFCCDGSVRVTQTRDVRVSALLLIHLTQMLIGHSLWTRWLFPRHCSADGQLLSCGSNPFSPSIQRRQPQYLFGQYERRRKSERVTVSPVKTFSRSILVGEESTKYFSFTTSSCGV